MIDENAALERASRGARYQELLREGEVTGALDGIERQYAEAWATTASSEERENLWRAVQVVRKIKQHFGQLAGDGKLATHQLTELRRLNK